MKRADVSRPENAMTQKSRGAGAIIEPVVPCDNDLEADRLGSANRLIRQLAVIAVS